MNVCFCRVRFSFFHTKPRDCLGETWSVVPGFEVDGVTEGGGDFSALAACSAFFDAALIAAAPSTQHTQAHNNDQVIQVAWHISSVGLTGHT